MTTKQDTESANALASAAVPGATAATGVTAVAGGANTGEPAGSDLNLPTAAKQAETNSAESKSNGVKPADAKPVAPRSAEPKLAEPKSVETPAGAQKLTEPKSNAPKSVDTKASPPKAAEPKSTESRPSTAKATDPKPAESKPATAKAAEAKAPDGKSSAGSSAETKPVEVYIVPLGTFSERDNALNVQRRAEQLGIPAFNEPVVTAAGERVRVRAGPFATHEQAERAHTRLRDAGLDALSTRKIEKHG